MIVWGMRAFWGCFCRRGLPFCLSAYVCLLSCCVLKSFVFSRAVATSSGYGASGLDSLRVAAVTPAAWVAAGGESYYPPTCVELWAIHVLTNFSFSAASAMSADAEAALGGAEALGVVAVPTTMLVFSDVPFCLVCCAYVLFFSTGG